MEVNRRLGQALWRLYNRPPMPDPWSVGSTGSQAGNLPWDDPAFSERMLGEHLDQSHGAASRATAERDRQLPWLWAQLQLEPGHQLLDVTCGPGLYATEFALRGVEVTGLDYSPAAIRYAKELAQRLDVASKCRFQRQDVRQMELPKEAFSAAIMLYGQITVFTAEETAAILGQIAAALRPGGRLILEVLDPDQIDKENSNWWYADDRGLWGDAPYLHLGERFWDDQRRMALERFHIIHLETGRMDVIHLCDQAYLPEELTSVLIESGFKSVTVAKAWDDLGLYDAQEWLVYLATK